MTKFVTKENLKQVLQKIKNEINGQASSKYSIIEGYFKTMNGSKSFGLKCKIYEYSDRYEVYSNLETSLSYDKTLPDSKIDRLITPTIYLRRSYSSWKSVLGDYTDYAKVSFKLGAGYFVLDDNTSKNVTSIYFTDNTKHYVYLGTLYKA